MQISVSGVDGNHTWHIRKFALLDCGSNPSVVIQSFWKKSIPGASLSRSNVSLQLASYSVNINFLYTTKLSILFQSNELKVETFYEFSAVPSLSSDVILGLPFFLDVIFHSMSKTHIYLGGSTKYSHIPNKRGNNK